MSLETSVWSKNSADLGFGLANEPEIALRNSEMIETKHPLSCCVQSPGAVQ